MAEDPFKKALKAWHASPYDFEKFGPMERVSGTGQGEAKYGRGAVYAAEDPAVSGPGMSFFADLMLDHPAVKKGVSPYSYEVRIHLQPETTLDWDSKIDDHHTEVQSKLKSMGVPTKKNTTGAHVYSHLTRTLGSDYHASSALHDAGIHGIKYLDYKSSREPGPAKLVFDGSDVEPWDTRNKKLMARAGRDDDYANASKISRAIENEMMPPSSIDQLVKMEGAEDIFGLDLIRWMKKNKHRLNMEFIDPPTHNYVIFHPDFVEAVAQYDIKGNKVKDLSPGVHLKAVDHDPFKEEK